VQDTEIGGHVATLAARLALLTCIVVMAYRVLDASKNPV
jgi:hypothetical protein